MPNDDGENLPPSDSSGGTDTRGGWLYKAKDFLIRCSGMYDIGDNANVNISQTENHINAGIVIIMEQKLGASRVDQGSDSSQGHHPEVPIAQDRDSLRGEASQVASAGLPEDIFESEAMVTYEDPDVPSETSTVYSYTSRPRTDIYSLGLLTHRAGYPLYMPTPSRTLPLPYRMRGIGIGDVGVITADGAFDFFFSVCRSDLEYPPVLPNGLELIEPIMTVGDKFLPGACLLSDNVVEDSDCESSSAFQCSEAEGAVLTLPEGATIHAATNRLHFQSLASRHAVSWYKYMLEIGKDSPNGSLYLVTECTKSVNWGTAVFYARPRAGDNLRFVLSEGSCRWQRRGKVEVRTGPGPRDIRVTNDEEPNQCVFLRGYKIMLRPDIWDNLKRAVLVTSQGGGFSFQSFAGVSATSRYSTQGNSNSVTHPIRRSSGSNRGTSSLSMGVQPTPAVQDNQENLADMSGLLNDQNLQPEVILEDYFNEEAPLHPSDLINIMLLRSKPEASVALVHDNEWCDHLPVGFIADPMNPNIEGFLENVRRSSKAVVDENGSVVLVNSAAVDPDYKISAVAKGRPITLAALPVQCILPWLDIRDIRACALISRQFNTITRSWTVLQYDLACHAAGVVDNPQCELPCLQRYDALLKRETAWRMLQPVFTKKFYVAQKPLSIYNAKLTAGIFLSNVKSHNVHYYTLPSAPNDVLPLTTIGQGDGPNRKWKGYVIGRGTAIHEHDLIVNVVPSRINTGFPAVYSLDMIFLQFSTGDYHPLASYPQIRFHEINSILPDHMCLEIVGDSLALTFQDRLFIFGWKTGHKRLEHQAEAQNLYSSLLFVSSEILVVPSVTEGRYEVWKIPKNATTVPYQVLILQLPALTYGWRISNIDCCCEPTSYPHDGSKPFFTSADDVIIATSIDVIPSSNEKGLRLTLFINRQTLLDVIRDLTRAETAFASDVDDQFNKMVVSNSGHESGLRSSSSTVVATDFQAHDGQSTKGEVYRVCSIPWSEWGPPISRWITSGLKKLTSWTSTSRGQRWATLEPVHGHHGRKSRIKLIDFNRYNAQDRLPGGVAVAPNGDLSNPGNVFADDFEMGLGCTVYTSPEMYNFDELMMDEERLLGLKLDYHNRARVREITALYFG